MPSSCINAVKLLGIFIDSRLTWNEHIDNLSRKLSRILFLLRKLKFIVTNDCIRMAYFAFFHAHLLYGINLWGSAPSSNKIFLLQKKAVRIICGVSSTHHCRLLFRETRIMTLSGLYILSSLISVKDSVHNLTLRSDIHGYNTRNKDDVVVPYSRLQRAQNSYYIAAIKFFNCLPKSVQNLSIDKFKSVLKNG